MVACSGCEFNHSEGLLDDLGQWDGVEYICNYHRRNKNFKYFKKKIFHNLLKICRGHLNYFL